MTNGESPDQRPSMDLAAWYPRLVEAGVPVPRTILVHTDADLTLLMDGATPDGFDTLVNDITAAANHIGYPCFLRTGHGSGKHQWKNTCYLTSPTEVVSHVAGLVDWSFSVDFFGLPTHTWVVRELLPVEAPFVAFAGMPISKERRYFLDANSQVVGHHPYWPGDALKGANPRLADGSALSDEQWMPLLETINTETVDEITELTALTENVGSVIRGAWSVDWLWSPVRGWVCIDLAHAERSFVWTEHPNAPTFD